MTGWLLGIGASALILGATVAQWHGAQSIAVADGIGYISAGVSLVRTGQLINPFGMPDTWFPPLYPALIGLFSFSGTIDPLVVARLTSMAASLATLLILVRLPANAGPAGVMVGGLAALLLAANPLFQFSANAALSEACATMFAVASIAVWHRIATAPTLAARALLGALIGLGYLTRPEVLLLFPTLAAIDTTRSGQRLRTLRHYLVSAIALALVAAPYVTWLSLQTGRLTFSDKSEVNLAAGRASYYGVPREVIDPVSLDLRFAEVPLSVGSEIRRYGFNWSQIGASYADIFRFPFYIPLLGLAAIGIYSLVESRRWQALCGVLALTTYVPIVAVYAVDPRYLHTTLPALSLLMACGTFSVVDRLQRLKGPSTTRLACVAFLVVAGVAIVEGATRYPRWSLTAPTSEGALLKEAGQRLRKVDPRVGVVYEHGATVGYYAGKTRRRLTSDDWPLIARHIEHVERDTPAIWLALSSQHAAAYHPSVRNLLDRENAGFARIVELTDEAGTAVVLKIR